MQRTPYTCLGIVRNHSRVHGAFGARSVRAKVLTRAQQTLCPNNIPKLYPPPELRPEAPPACPASLRQLP